MSNVQQNHVWPGTTISALLFIALSGCLDGSSPQAAARQPGSTESVPGAAYTIYAAGDIADCKNLKPEHSAAAKTAALVASALAQNRDAAVLTLGDNTYPVGLPLEFDNCYDPTWGRFKARTYPAPGNHDYYTPAAIGYYGYFGASAGPEQRGYFSVELGQWHVVSLNSNLKGDEQRRQLEWLKADLAQHPTRCALAYWHHPLFSSGGHGNNAQMKDAWQILSDGGVDVVLNGHDHDYERFAPQNGAGVRDELHGMRQFVVGTGGTPLTPIGFPKRNSEASYNSAHGVLKLALKETGYEWEFLPVAGDRFSDRGVTLCH